MKKTFLLLLLLLFIPISTATITHVGVINGSGSPNYLGQPWDVEVVGDYAYVISEADDSLSIFDVSDPTTPTLLGSIQGAGAPNYLNTPSDIEISGSYAYIVSYNDQALTIFDISDPTNPVHVGVITGDGSPNYLYFAASINVTGNYAYITSYGNPLVAPVDEALTIFDISDPTNPVHVGSVTGGGAPNYLNVPSDIEVSGNYAYVTSVNEDSLVIFDISNPASPTYAARMSGAGAPNYLNDPWDVDILGDYAYVLSLMDTSLSIFDISDPTSPSLSGVIHNSGSCGAPYYICGYSLDVYENHVYVSSQLDDAISIFNISDQTTPVYIEAISGAGSPNYLDYIQGLEAFGNYLYVAGYGDSALTIFDISGFVPQASPTPTPTPIPTPTETPITHVPYDPPAPPIPTPLPEPELTIIEEIIQFFLTPFNWLLLLFAYLGAFFGKVISDSDNDDTEDITADTLFWGTVAWILVLIVNFVIPIISMQELFVIVVFVSVGFVLAAMANYNNKPKKVIKSRRK